MNTSMLYNHFYQHFLAVNDPFVIWSFDQGCRTHKVKEVISDLQFKCFCADDQQTTILCSDANYISSKSHEAPVVAHDEVTASPPSWRKIEIGKYVKVQDLLQVATFAVMVGGAILLHRAGMAAQASVDPMQPGSGSIIEQRPSRPMTISEMSDISVMQPAEIIPVESSAVEIEGEMINSLNVSIDSQTFREVSSCSHSLSGLSEHVSETFANSIVIAPDVECEIIANLENTFSESMFRPKSISIESYNGEFANPLTKKFINDVPSGKVFFENVLKNEPQLLSTTKDMVHAVINDIEVNGALNKNLSKQVISTLEKEVGGFKVFTNFTGSAKPPVPTVPQTPHDIQYYQSVIGQKTNIGSITQTTVDQSWHTAVTEIKRELLLQTSLDPTLINVSEVRHGNFSVTRPVFCFDRTNSPFIGHSCLIFDIVDKSISSIPTNLSFILIVGSESYLVRDIYDGKLWVYCNRSKLDLAEKYCKSVSSSEITLVPQKRRKYTFYMHVDVKIVDPRSLQVHQDVISAFETSNKIWILSGALRKRQCFHKSEKTISVDSRPGHLQLTDPPEWPLQSQTFMSPFQFNGIETLSSRIKEGFFLLPPVCTLLPFNFIQVCAFDSDHQVKSSETIVIDYKKGWAYGFMCGNDYLHVTQTIVLDMLKKSFASAAFRTVSFFSSYDYQPIRITKIVFNRPWVIYATFWYMRVELESEHGIKWSMWSKKQEEGYGANPKFTMDILGETAVKYLHVAHRCRLRISSIPDSKTLIFTTTEKGDEDHIHPDVFKSATLGFPLDENMSAFELYKRECERLRKPMTC